MKLSKRTIALTLCTAAVAAAQTTSAAYPGWQNLHRLRPGDAVRVVTAQSETIDGRIERWSSDEVSITRGNASARTLSAREVKQLSVRVSHSRLKGAGIAAAIGFGAGFSLGALSAGYLTDRNNPSFGSRVEAGRSVGGVGAGVGALIGVFAGGSRYHTVYRARQGGGREGEYAQ